MAVFRIEKTKNYTVMSNYHLRDTNLSLRSIALLSIMLSLPENWDYSLRGLTSICKDGRDAIGASLRELEKAGYLRREQKRDSHGRLSDIEYTVYEYPRSLSPCTGNPDTVNPDTENPNPEIPDTDRPDTAEPDTEIPSEESKEYINNIKYNKRLMQNREKRKKESIDLSVDGDSMKDRWIDQAYSERIALKNVLSDNIGLKFIIRKNRSLEEQLEHDEITAREYETAYVDPAAADYMLDIMTDCVSGPQELPVRINGEDIPRAQVRDRLMKVDKGKFLAVYRAVKGYKEQIRNRKAYILSALYNEGPPSI